MSFFYFVELILFMVVGYMCIESVVDRICKCIEHCHSVDNKDGETDE